MKYFRLFIACIWFVLKKIFALVLSAVLLMLLGVSIFLIICFELVLILVPFYGLITPTLLAITTKRPFEQSMIITWETILDQISKIGKSHSSSARMAVNLLSTNREIIFTKPNFAFYLAVGLLVVLTIIFLLKITGISSLNTGKNKILFIARKITYALVFLWKL